ncbi:MAG: SlyX family protein [Ketobacter sp.]
MSQEKLDDLEAKLAFQEHELNQLHDSLYESQRRIDVLERQMTELVKRYQQMSEKLDDDMPADQKPPHY